MLTPGALALLRRSPFAPPVRIASVIEWPRFNRIDVNWRHDALGYGHAPQRSNASALSPLPPQYVPPPADWPGRVAWIDTNMDWLLPVYGAATLRSERSRALAEIAEGPKQRALADQVVAEMRTSLRGPTSVREAA